LLRAVVAARAAARPAAGPAPEPRGRRARGRDALPRGGRAPPRPLSPRARVLVPFFRRTAWPAVLGPSGRLARPSLRKGPSNRVQVPGWGWRWENRWGSGAPDLPSPPGRRVATAW